MSDYARINKNINFDQLNAKMHEAEHKDAKQLRVKHDWKTDGKVQMASKLKSEGKWPGWSGRSKKIANGKQFVLDSFKRSTGVDASQTIKNMIKTDQTAVQGGKTIGDMLNDVRDEWHKELSTKYSSGAGLAKVVDGLNLSKDEKARVGANKTLLKSIIQRDIEKQVRSNDGKMVHDGLAKATTEEAVKLFLAKSKTPNALSQLKNEWHNALANDFGHGQEFNDVLADKSKDLQPHQKSILNEFKQVGGMQNAVVGGKASIRSKVIGGGGLPVSYVDAKEVTKEALTPFVKLAGQISPQLAGKITGKLAAMKSAQTQQQAATIAKQLIKDVNDLDNTDQKIAGAQKEALATLIATSLSSRPDGGHEACREVGKDLLKIELGKCNDKGSLMRSNNPSSTFNAAYLGLKFSNFTDSVISQFNDGLQQIRMPEAPRLRTSANGPEQPIHDIDKVLKSPDRFFTSDGQPLSKQSPIYLKLKQQRNEAVVQAGSMLPRILSNTQMPPEMKQYISDLADTARDPDIVGNLPGDDDTGRTVINDSFSLRLVSSRLTDNAFSYDVTVRNKLLPPEQRINAQVARAGVSLFNTAFTSLPKGTYTDIYHREPDFEQQVGPQILGQIMNYCNQFTNVPSMGVPGMKPLPPQPSVVTSYEQGIDDLQTMISTYESMGYVMPPNQRQAINENVRLASEAFQKGDKNTAIGLLGQTQSMALEGITFAIDQAHSEPVRQRRPDENSDAGSDVGSDVSEDIYDDPMRNPNVGTPGSNVKRDTV